MAPRNTIRHAARFTKINILQKSGFPFLGAVRVTNCSYPFQRADTHFSRVEDVRFIVLRISRIPDLKRPNTPALQRDELACK